MNEQIANILKTQIDSLNFVDKIAGMVRPMTITKEKVKKIFPVSCDVTVDECVKGAFQ